MSLREDLIKPFVVEASKDHSHTVIFLHRFAQDTPPEQLPSKVLSAKLTKNHKTLAEQFPTVRWVFPYPKLHPDDRNGRPQTQHWSDLSFRDIEVLALPFGSDLPYITQVIIQEAQLAGGLDKVVLGGQGEGAIAAHDASVVFPELGPEYRQREGVERRFIDRFFHNPGWDALEQLRMAGFVGMHAQGGGATRDESDYGLSRRTSSSRIVNHTILRRTPHRFIRGGYKTKTITWDGTRIDEFASFLAGLGIAREGQEGQGVSGAPAPDPDVLAPRARPDAEMKEEARPGLTPQQRYALEVIEDKKANREARRLILMRIEEDKRNRRYIKERGKAARQFAAGTDGAPDDSAAESLALVPSPSRVDADKEDSPDTTISTTATTTAATAERRGSAAVIRQYEQRRKAWEAWPTMPDQLKTQWEPKTGRDMGEAQLRALGILGKEEDDDGRST